MNNPVKVLAGGTLGDAFLIVCRLKALHDIYGVNFELTRPSRPSNVYFDTPIASLFSLIPYVEYIGHRTDCASIYEHGTDDDRVGLRKLGYDICPISTAGIQSVFDKYTTPTCFFTVDSPDIALDEDPIVIQVQGGKYQALHGHMRGFALKTLYDMCEYFIKAGNSVYLIGVNHPILADDDKLEKLAEETGAHNCVGKTTLVEAISMVSRAKYFIGFDGFFTFFAPSQRVKTLQFSHLEYNPRIDFECPCWFDYTTMIRPIPAGAPIIVPMEMLERAVCKEL